MFHGSMVALVTPMNLNGQIDFDSLRNLIDWHIEQGTQAIVVVGTTGEAATLTEQEKHKLIDETVQHVNERIPVIAGTHANSTAQAIKLTFDAMELGADACLLMTPAYIKPTQNGLYQHYHTIATQVALPQILYNAPSRTACDLLPETVQRLADIPNIIGIKEATGDVNRLNTLLEQCGDRLDVYSGDDFTGHECLLSGGKGVISVTANIAPKAMRVLCDVALNKDVEKTNAQQQRLMPLHQALFLESNPIPTKWALFESGKIPAGIRLPLTSLSEKHHETVRNAMQL